MLAGAVKEKNVYKSCYYNIHRMLSYGALRETSTGQIFFYFFHGTPWFVPTF